MRITYKMMTDRYVNNLNSQSEELNRLSNQVSTGRAFSRTSEDTSTAVRAYQLRKDIAKVENYQDNIEYADDFLTNSETNMSTISDTLSNAMESILQGLNSTMSEDDRATIADELRTMQEEILETLNTSVSDVYIFGGSNTTEKPFTVNTAGNLCYNGVELSSLDLDDTTDLETYNSLVDDSLYVDIGLGVEFDASGEINKNSVFEYSITGISFVGAETTDDTGATSFTNIYDLLGEIATEFEKEDGDYSSDTAETLYGEFQEIQSCVNLSITTIGAKQNYLEFMDDRYTDQMLNYEERQTELEGIDTAEAYIAYTTEEVAYEAALEMGTSVIQQSVFDYMS